MTNKTNPKLEAAAKKIQAILEEEGCAIQPFLRTTPYGITPDARLVELNPENNEATTTGEDTTTETEQPTGTNESQSTEGQYLTCTSRV